MNKLKLLAGVFSAVILLFVTPTSSEAQVKEYHYDRIDVDIEVNEDSTAVVTEKLTYEFNGTFRGVFREITLEDEQNVERCRQNSALQCGGFDYIQVLEVYDDNGELIPEDEYTISEVYDSSFAENRLRIEWVFSDSGRNFRNETFSFTVKYKVYGSIGYFPEDNYDLLYWNAIFGDHEVRVDNVAIDIKFPGDVELDRNDLTVPGYAFDEYQWEYNSTNNSFTLITGNLRPYDELTLLLRLKEGVIDEPAKLRLTLDPDKQNIVVNEELTIESATSLVAGMPTGNISLEFRKEGYESKLVELELEPGTINELEVELKPTLLTIIKWIAIAGCNILGLFLFPLFGWLLYRRWKTKGADLGRRSTVIPLFRPPDEVRPYLLGSLKDESVDLVDITATIIDVAYRGFIKIKEFEAKAILGIKVKDTDYELIKLKDFAELGANEQKIMTDIFGSKERVTISGLKNKFYKKIPGIKDAVYDEMVERNYFLRRPDKVRSGYLAAGIGILVLGVGLVFMNALLPIFISTAISVIMGGLVLAIISKHMPAKTKKGSQIFDEVLGFKMYMETAERYRVQNLTPETFEKYLSYAIVFGIEEKWAETFKDIYKGQPDWYESQTNTFNTIYLANALGNFRTSAGSTLASSPSSSGSASGGGWSGGGGFSGGFSGGGGGGGGGGAF